MQYPPDADTTKSGADLDADGCRPVLSVTPSNHTLAWEEHSNSAKNSLRTAARVESVVMTDAPFINMRHRAVVRTAQTRQPEVGDKFCSRHGQKGVLGLLVPATDLPFTADGTTLDFLINPHAFPSRMSIGHLMEDIAGKVAIMTGQPVDGTPFDAPTLVQLRQLLESGGAHPSAGVVLFDPLTGLPLPGRHMVVPQYYMRLTHNVQDKTLAQSVTGGALDPRSGQPMRGYTRNGSLRTGEMEKDAYIAWGACAALHERFLTLSDGTVAAFCRDCGLPALEAAMGDNSRGVKRRCNRCAVRAARAGLPYLPRIATAYVGRSTICIWIMLSAMGIALRARFEE